MDAGYPRQSEPMASQPRKSFPVWPWNMYIPVHYLRVTQTIPFGQWNKRSIIKSWQTVHRP